MFAFLKRLFSSPAATPETTLIKFNAQGCMAHDWHEIDRGVIVGEFKRVDYGSPTPNRYYRVERPDGSQFDAYIPYCHWGNVEMQQRTQNPDESLVGKMVYTI